METNELYDKPSRIHWTAIISLCLCIIAALSALSTVLPPMDFERSLPSNTILWVLPICSVSGMIFGCIALSFAQKPVWKKGLRLTATCLLFDTVLILISLLYIFYVTQLV
ncbi:MAG TPA: hypothetical protein VKY19_09115 [Ktedonosporobacter sp.]|jgi:hypothetical protein|nr:hypothetical protein [Ktedonosporobacter sp.]